MQDRRARDSGQGQAVAIAVAGAILIVVLNSVLTVTAGLLAVAAVTGYLVGQALRIRLPSAARAESVPGAEGTPRVESAPRPAQATALGVGLAIGAVVVGALGTWLVALAQGGVLGPLDYLGQAFGLLLPALVIVAAGGAWIGEL